MSAEPKLIKWNSIPQKWMKSELSAQKAKLNQLEKATQFARFDSYKQLVKMRREIVELCQRYVNLQTVTQPQPTCPKCGSTRILDWPDKYQCRRCEHIWINPAPDIEG